MRVVLHDIKKYFGPVRANDGISLTLEPGRVHGLLGENGAGKTTLMKILSGYQARDGGTILVDEAPVTFHSPTEATAAGIGMLHQGQVAIGFVLTLFAADLSSFLGNPYVNLPGPYVGQQPIPLLSSRLTDRFAGTTHPRAGTGSFGETFPTWVNRMDGLIGSAPPLTLCGNTMHQA